MTLDTPRVVAIVNATPDSFYTPSRHADPEAAAAFALRAVDDGAAILDIGGESTRPGADRVDADEQIRRVIPVIRSVREAGVSAPISIDTTRAAVAEAALDAGADVINDVSAGQEDPEILRLAAARKAGVILMHRLRAPDADHYSDQYPDVPRYEGGVVNAVTRALAAARDRAIAAGVKPESIVLDPGLGFGKSVEDNYALIRAAGAMQRQLDRPLISAASRKSFLGVPGDPEPTTAAALDPALRLPASLAVSVVHALAGIRLFRVHDPAEHVRALETAMRAGSTGVE